MTYVTGYNLFTTSCLGDSNTQIVGSTLTYWCAVMGNLFTHPNWRAINRGAPYATVLPGATLNGQPDGPTQLATALANDAPDAAIAAFGGNDINFLLALSALFGSGTPTVEPIVTAYRDLKATAESNHLAMFIALTGPQGTYTPSQSSELALQLNNRIRHEFPRERIIDFHSPIVPSDFTPPDLVHLNQSGQNKRGQVAHREVEN